MSIGVAISQLRALRVHGALTLRYKRRSVAGERRARQQTARHKVLGTFASVPSAGRYHRFVSIAAVIPSLVEPVRADSLV